MHIKKNMTAFYNILCLNVGVNQKFKCHMKNVTISTEVKYKNVIILTEGQAFSLKTGISF